jgi:hypothetical protein
MKDGSKWDEASSQFVDFIDDIMENHDDNCIGQSGEMLSFFSHFIISIEEKELPIFKYFFQLMAIINDSGYSTDEKQRIIFKVLGILKQEYPDFYNRYNFFDL